MKEEGKNAFPPLHLCFYPPAAGKLDALKVKPACGAEPVKNRTISETLSDFFPLPGLQLLDRVSPAHLVQQMAQLTRERGE